MKHTAALVGSNFYPPARRLVSELSHGQKVFLVREPNNKFDTNAIGVYLKLGHIEAKNGSAAMWSKLLDAANLALYEANTSGTGAAISIDAELPDGEAPTGIDPVTGK